MKELEMGTHRQIYCNTCKGDTHHELKAIQSRSKTEIIDEGTINENLGWWEQTEYRFWVCKGCDTATLEVAYTDAAHYGTDSSWHSVLHPKRVGLERPLKNFRSLDIKLSTVYREVVSSFNSGLRVICPMGLRALLEGICVNKGIKDDEAWGLEKKLTKLEEATNLPSNIVECLLGFKFMGDDAAHRLEASSQEELALAIDVMEDLLNFLYEMEYQLTDKAKRFANKQKQNGRNKKSQSQNDEKSVT